jgi:hypothetical protein
MPKYRVQPWAEPALMKMITAADSRSAAFQFRGLLGQEPIDNLLVQTDEGTIEMVKITLHVEVLPMGEPIEPYVEPNLQSLTDPKKDDA